MLSVVWCVQRYFELFEGRILKTRLLARSNILFRSALALMLLFGFLLSGAVPVAVASSDVTFDGSPGTAAPPATLGPYTMTPFPADPRPAGWGAIVTSVPGPTGDLQFDREAHHAIVSTHWLTWSHGYTGSIYYVGDTEVTITLPPNTLAFYLYVQSNSYGEYPFTVEADGASSGEVLVVGNAGAKYFGFYSLTDPIHSVTVSTVAGAGGFAVGEFGIASGVPAAPVSPRADVAAIIYGGWSGIPVNAWVGGTLQPTLATAPNHEGEAAVLFTFWPPAGTTWQVSVAPSLPAGLDPARWEMKLLWIETSAGFMRPTGSTVRISQGSHYVLHYQLIDNGATP